MAKLKWPKHLKYFELPLFGGTCFICYKREDWEQAMNYLSVETDTQACGGQAIMLDHPDGGILYLIGIYQHDYGIVAHEAVHISQYCMNFVGSDDDETQAYLVQRIFDEVVKYIPKDDNETKSD